jgi:hypothetical protein
MALGLAQNKGHGVFVEEVLLAWMPTASLHGCIYSVFRNKHSMAISIRE